MRLTENTSVLNTMNWNSQAYYCYPALQLYDEETYIAILCQHELADDTVKFI
jgi:hypothetical protein